MCFGHSSDKWNVTQPQLYAAELPSIVTILEVKHKFNSFLKFIINQNLIGEDMMIYILSTVPGLLDTFQYKYSNPDNK